MPLSKIAAPVCALACLLLLAPLAAREPQQFRTGAESVPLYVTVTDSERRLVPDLVKDDFEVYDNGQLQTITSFDNTPLPITVVVTLDTSASMTLALDLVKQAAEQFVIRMRPEDAGMVSAFNDKVQFIPRDEFTSDRDFLIRSLQDLGFGNATRLYDAVDESIDKLQGVEGRRVVLVFTDGDDTASRGANSRRMQEKARAEDVMIYAIGLENLYFNGQRNVLSRPDRGLRGLAEETGGGYFLLKRTDELNSTFTRVAQELRSQYVLGFTPQMRDGKVHKLEVRVKRPGTTPRARRSYVAPTGS
jgi:Ca-activated chloride channel homolog